MQVTTSAFTAILTLYLVRALSPAGYGLFALAFAISGLVGLPSDFGITGSAARFIAERRGDRAAVVAVVADALKLKAASSGLVALALFAAAGPIASGYGDPRLTWPLRGFAVALFASGLVSFVSYTFVALGRVSVNVRITFAESLVETIASIGLVLLGLGATGATFGRAIGYVVGAAVALAIMARTLGPRILSVRGFEWRRARGIASYAAALAIVDGVWTIFSKVDALLIGAFLGTASVGLFQAPMRLVVLLQYPGQAIANGVAPTLARVREGQRNVRAFVTAVRVLIIFEALAVTPFLIWPRPITGLLLGSGYDHSAVVLRALVPFVFLSGLVTVVSSAVDYLGEVRRRMPLALAALALNTIIDVILIPRIGIVGAAIGTDAGMAIYVGGQLVLCWRLLGLPVRSLVASGLRAAAAGCAMAALLLLLGTNDLSIVDWLLGVAVGPLVFAATLVAIGEISFVELMTAFGTVTRRFALRL